MTTYKPFCSLECNRAYSATVAGGGYGHGPNDEPYCLNCGARTEAMGSARRQAAGGRWFVWQGNSQGEPVQPISGPYRTAQEAEQDFPPGGAYPFFALQSGPNTSWPGIPYEARRRTAHRHPTDPPRRRATRRHAAREYTAWGCTDCAMFVANGEPPLRDPETGLDWSQAEEEAWVQEWANENRGIIWSLGDDEDDFSWRACDLCGTALGGARHEFYGFDHG